MQTMQSMSYLCSPHHLSLALQPTGALPVGSRGQSPEDPSAVVSERWLQRKDTGRRQACTLGAGTGPPGQLCSRQHVSWQAPSSSLTPKVLKVSFPCSALRSGVSLFQKAPHQTRYSDAATTKESHQNVKQNFITNSLCNRYSSP